MGTGAILRGQNLTLALAPLRSLLKASFHLSSARLHLLFFRSPFSSSSSSRRKKSQQNSYDEESKTIGISVWWDYENCPIPDGVNAYRISNRILSALRSNGIRGPVSINAFGDMRQIPRATQEALFFTGIRPINVPGSGENSANKLLMADLKNWTTHNLPPTHFFLISNDSVFSTILHRLRMNNYNVLLSCSQTQVKASLYSSATLMWPWISLAKGEDFTPLQFNYPPDGMYGSWYGHQKGSLDDPFEKELMERIAEMNTTPTMPEPEVPGHLRMAFNRLLFTELNGKNICEEGFRKYLSLINTMPYADLFSLGRALKIWPRVERS